MGCSISRASALMDYSKRSMPVRWLFQGRFTSIRRIRLPGKATVSLEFRQISDADVRVQGMPVESIVVGGAVKQQQDQHDGVDQETQGGRLAGTAIS